MGSQINSHELEVHTFWMNKALMLAKKAASRDEVPVGAVLVGPEGLISSGYNLRETLKTPLGHAEVLTIHRASKNLKSWRLLNATLYVTLEPCTMCAGTILQARIPNLIYGASDPKGGAVGSLLNLLSDARFNHQVNVLGGVLDKECSALLTQFFKKMRGKK